MAQFEWRLVRSCLLGYVETIRRQKFRRIFISVLIQRYDNNFLLPSPFSCRISLRVKGISVNNYRRHKHQLHYHEYTTERRNK